MPEQDTEAVTEVTGEQDDYLSYDTSYINEKLLEIDNKLSNISAKFDVISGKSTEYNDKITDQLSGISEHFTVLNGAVSDRNAYNEVFGGALSMMIGLIVGILIIGKYWK